MHKRGHDFDYQFDWTLRKAGQKVPPGDFVNSKWEESKVQGGQGKGMMEMSKTTQFAQRKASHGQPAQNALSVPVKNNQQSAINRTSSANQARPQQVGASNVQKPMQAKAPIPLPQSMQKQPLKNGGAAMPNQQQNAFH